MTKLFTQKKLMITILTLSIILLFGNSIGNFNIFTMDKPIDRDQTTKNLQKTYFNIKKGIDFLGIILLTFSISFFFMVPSEKHNNPIKNFKTSVIFLVLGIVILVLCSILIDTNNKLKQLSINYGNNTGPIIVLFSSVLILGVSGFILVPKITELIKSKKHI